MVSAICVYGFAKLRKTLTDKAETPPRGNDANVITAVKKKITKRIFKIVAAVCLVFAALISAIMLYTGIGYSVTKDNISLSTKTDGGYTYIILEIEAGKSLFLILKMKIF